MYLKKKIILKNTLHYDRKHILKDHLFLWSTLCLGTFDMKKY